MKLFQSLKKESILFLFLGIVLAFFYKSVFLGQVPFPGALLVSHYNPYKAYSFLGYNPGSYPHKGQNIDVVEQLYPWKYFSLESLKSGEFPLWNPYNFSGTPHIAAIQSGTFYPFNLLFLVLPFVLAWSIYIVIQPILAWFFTYLFLREIKLSGNSAILGGLVFAFSSFLVVWMQYGNMVHALVWLPLILLMILKNLRNPTVLKSIVTSVVLSFSIFAGHFQISMYLYIFSFIFSIYVIYHFYRDRFMPQFLILIGIYLFSLSLSAVQLLPSIEIFLNSSRTDYSLSRIVEFLVPQYHIISMFFPDFFGNPVSRNYWLSGTYIERVTYFGIVPLFFAVYALVSKKSSYVWFFLATIIAVFFIAFDSYITRFLYSVYIPPIIGSSVPTRIIYLFTFAGSVLAAFGYSQLESGRNIKSFIISVLVMSSVIILALAFVIFSPTFIEEPLWIENMFISLRNMIVPTVAFLLATFVTFIYLKSDSRILRSHSKSIKKLFFLTILFITVAELFFFFNKFTPFSPKEAVYPETSVFDYIKDNQDYYRTWGYGSAAIPANIHTYEEIYSTDGYDPFYIRRYGELLSSTREGKVPDSIQRANARLSKGFGEENLRNNIYRQKIMNLLGVKYIIHKKSQDNDAYDKTFDENVYDLVWNEHDLQIYENTDVLPRTFLATDYVVLESDDEIIKTLYANDFNPSQTIILEENPGIEKYVKSGEHVAAITEYKGNQVSIQTDSEERALLFLSDAHYPGWKAYVNGEKTKVYRANYAFRAIVVPEGNSHVVFRYEPLLFYIGLWISILSFGGTALYVLFTLLKKRQS